MKPYEIEKFRKKLIKEEKAEKTVEKYVRDVMQFCEYCNGEITKEKTALYKKALEEKGYKPRSINSMIASANAYLTYTGNVGMKMKSLKLQKEVFCSAKKELSKAEYEKLCRAAMQNGNERLCLLLQTICASGIRVSELPFVTVESLDRGEVTVTLKGKTRTVFLVKELRKKLLAYCREQGIKTGPVFITKNGKPIERTNVWREMKNLCKKAKVDSEKVFPHNLRHLFARSFYALDKDIAKLADVLGHSSIETTRLYIISTGTEHRKRMEKLNLII